MNVIQKKNFLINLTYASVMLLIAFGIFRFTTLYLMPFVFGFIIASIVKPLINFTRKLFGTRKMLSIVVVILFYILIGALLFWAVLRFIAYVQILIPMIEAFYSSTLLPVVTSVAQSTESWLKQLDPNMANIVDTAMAEISSTLVSITRSISGFIVSWLTGLVTSIPSLFVAILITIISSFFFTNDYQNIVNSTLNVLSPKTRQFIMDVRELLSILVGKYLKSYMIIISVTFVELAIGFFVIGIPNPVFVAAVIAMIDILPVLGTGTVLIPWAIYCFIIGDVSLGIGISIVYAIVTIVRNILEPKVIGHEIGLHPLATLVSIFVGLNLFGFWGLFFTPIFVTIISTLHKEGKIDFFRFFGFREANGDEIGLEHEA